MKLVVMLILLPACIVSNQATVYRASLGIDPQSKRKQQPRSSAQSRVADPWQHRSFIENHDVTHMGE